MVSASSPCSASSSRAATRTPAWLRPARCPGVRWRLTLRIVRRTAKLYGVQFTNLEQPMTEPITGRAAGVPFIAVPPANGPRPDAPTVVGWHLLDPPRTEAAL